MYGRVVSFLIQSALKHQRKEQLRQFEDTVRGEVERDYQKNGSSPDKPSRYAKLFDNGLMKCEEEFQAPTNSLGFWLVGLPLLPTFFLLAATSAERLPTQRYNHGSSPSLMEIMLLGLLILVVGFGALAALIVSIHWALTVRPGVSMTSYSLAEFAAITEHGGDGPKTRLPQTVRKAPGFQAMVANRDRMSIISYRGLRTDVEFFTLCYLMPNGENATIAFWYESPSHSVCETEFPAIEL